MLLNADIGEMTGHDQVIMPHISLGNIACGGHVSDPEHMAQTVDLALANNVKICAHPSYPDQKNFGRVSMTFSDNDELTKIIDQQVTTLADICSQKETALYAIKPHGALYNDMARDNSVKQVMEKVARKHHLPMLVPAQPQEDQANWQCEIIPEAFADRAYCPDASLMSRALPNSLHTDSQIIIAQAKQLINQQSVITHEGCTLKLSLETLCFHGDNPASVQALKALYA